MDREEKPERHKEKSLKSLCLCGFFPFLVLLFSVTSARNSDLPNLVSKEELQTELCSVPFENRERETAMAKLFQQAGAKKVEIKYQVVDGTAHNVYVVKPGRTRDVIVVGGHI